MILRIISLLLLVVLVAGISRYNTFIAGVLMTFPVVTFTTLLLQPSMKLRSIALGGLVGLFPLFVLLLIFYFMADNYGRGAALFTGLAVWFIIASLSIYFLGGRL